MNGQTRWRSLVVICFLVRAGSLHADEAEENVLIADSFETGTRAPEGWRQGAAVPGVRYLYDRRIASDGKRSLSLQKSANRYFPIAGWTRRFKHDSEKPALEVAAKVKASKATKAIIDVIFLDENNEWIKHEWAVYIGQKDRSDPLATHDWKKYAGALEIPVGTKHITIALQMYGPGKVWFDELEARYLDSVADAKKDDPQGSATRTSGQKPSTATVDIPRPIEVRTSSGAATRYLLIAPDDDVTEPESGYPMLLVLPGGDGSADFHPFVRRVHEHALDGRFVVAQPLAPPHRVWPTKSSLQRSTTTEDSIAAIIDDVADRLPIDVQQVHALAWSSSGPAVYAALLQEHSPFAKAFIAMSVFKPDDLPSLSYAAGRRIYLLHSPEDAVCPYRMAKNAQRQLAAAGARVTLAEYAGGHGWHGPIFENIRVGVEWLQEAK